LIRNILVIPALAWMTRLGHQASAISAALRDAGGSRPSRRLVEPLARL
jgi:hypothetical protein